MVNRPEIKASCLGSIPARNRVLQNFFLLGLVQGFPAGLGSGPDCVHGLPSQDWLQGHGRGRPPSIIPLKPLYNPLTRQGLRREHQEIVDKLRMLVAYRVLICCAFAYLMPNLTMQV